MPSTAEQEAVNAIVDIMDPITLWRWKKAIDERLNRKALVNEEYKLRKLKART
jgi:hypothetical protein